AAGGPRPELRRLRRAARADRARAAARAGGRPRGRRARRGDRGARRPHRTRAQRPRRADRRLDDARGAPSAAAHSGARRRLTVGALEPRFFARLCALLGRPELAERQWDGDQAALRDELAAVFARRTLAEWLDVFEGEDVCVGPVAT